MFQATESDPSTGLERLGASPLRFSARAVAVRRNAHPRPSCGGLQEIVMLTLIEESRPAELIGSPSGHLGCLAGLFKALAWPRTRT
jgi:hypothetical protein